MARRLKPAESARHARLLLDQAIALLDEANLGHVAVHADLARQLVDQWLCLSDPMPVVGDAGVRALAAGLE